jgi:hypothetical protein
MAANLSLDGPELRFLSEDNDIHVDKPPAVLVQAGHGFANKPARIGSLISRIGVRISVADIPQSSGSQQSINYRVQDYVSVAMAGQAARMGDFHAAQEQWAARFQAVGIVANADAHARVSGGRSTAVVDCSDEGDTVTTRVSVPMKAADEAE